MGINKLSEMTLLRTFLVMMAIGAVLALPPRGSIEMSLLEEVAGTEQAMSAEQASAACSKFCGAGCESEADANKLACKACAECWKKAEKLHNFVERQHTQSEQASV